MPLKDATRQILLHAARESIRRGFPEEEPRIVPGGHDPILGEPRATFVTLMRRHTLRGCIGSLEARRGLLEDVINNAEAAAFRDPRFPPLHSAELPEVEIEISVLSPPSPLPVRDRAELLQRLEAGRHGLILQEGVRRATFLPAVWESLPRPEDFLAALLHKAGLERDHWSDRLRFFTYTTESFAERST